MNNYRMLIYFLTNGHSWGNINDCLTIPSSNLPIIFSYDHYVHLVTPTEFLSTERGQSQCNQDKTEDKTEEKDQDAKSEKSEKSEKEIKCPINFIIFLPDDLLSFYDQCRKHTDYVYLLAVHSKPNGLKENSDTLKTLDPSKYLFQSSFQLLCYREWLGFQLEGKVLPLYGIECESLKKIMDLVSRNTTNCETEETVNVDSLSPQKHLIVFDRVCSFSLYLKTKFENLGYKIGFWSHKNHIYLQKSAYLFIVASKLSSFPSQILAYLEKGVPFISCDYPSLIHEERNSLSQELDSGGVVLKREDWDTVFTAFETITSDYVNFSQGARKLFTYLNAVSYQISSSVLSSLPITDTDVIVDVDVDLDDNHDNNHDNNHDAHTGLKVSKWALKAMRKNFNDAIINDSNQLDVLINKSMVNHEPQGVPDNKVTNFRPRKFCPQNIRNHHGQLPNIANTAIRRTLVRDRTFKNIAPQF